MREEPLLEQIERLSNLDSNICYKNSLSASIESKAIESIQGVFEETSKCSQCGICFEFTQNSAIKRQSQITVKQILPNTEILVEVKSKEKAIKDLKAIMEKVSSLFGYHHGTNTPNPTLDHIRSLELSLIQLADSFTE
jgi:Pyruvate/2-oxoacid:ferredoxin oxidoreductase delta subunit